MNEASNPEIKNESAPWPNTGKNTDKEIWRKVEGNYYSPSIHVTESGGIGINVGGIVIVKPIEDWHSVMFNFMDGFKMRLGKASLAGKVVAIEDLPTERDIRDILIQWEHATDKDQCCSSCYEDKATGYGDDIETCCCRHENSEDIAKAIHTLIESEAGVRG
jgi:hypothetical protein